MNEPARHHFVPQFYLSNFLDTKARKKRVWVYDKVTNTPRQQAPENIAFQKHLYTLTADNGEKDNRIEHFLGLIETRSAPVLRRLQVIGATLQDDHEVYIMATFLGFMHARNPANIQLSSQILKRLGPQIARGMITRKAVRKHYEAVTLQTEQNEAAFEKLYEAVQRTTITMTNPDETAMAINVLQVSMDALSKIFFCMNWTLFEAPGDTFFVTSDAPVSSFVETDQCIMYAHGFGHPLITVTFPISPRLCLIMRHQKVPNQPHVIKRRFARPDEVKQINRHTIHNAERTIFSHLLSDDIAKAVKQNAYTLNHDKATMADNILSDMYTSITS